MPKQTAGAAAIRLFRQRLDALTKEVGEIRDRLRDLIDDAEALYETVNDGADAMAAAAQQLDYAADQMSQYA